MEVDDVWTLSQGQVTIAEEVGEAQVSWPPLAREGEARYFTARVVDVDTVFMDHDGVAFAVAGPVAVDHRELGDRGRLDPVEPGSQSWSALTFDELVVGRAASRALQSPLPHEGGTLVKELHDVSQRDALDDAIPPERRDRYVDVGCHVRPLGRIDRHPVFNQRAPTSFHATLSRSRQRGSLLAALDRHEGVHQPQTLECIAGIADFASEDFTQILLDVRPGQSGPAEKDRIAGGQPPGVQLLQVLLHYHGGFHQEPGHPDGVRSMLLGRLDDRPIGCLMPRLTTV